MNPKLLRISLVVFLSVFLIPGAVAAPGECTGNLTADEQQLCEEIDRLEDEVQSKSEQIQNLEFQLEQQADQEDTYREIGAWDPQTQEPAFMITRISGEVDSPGELGVFQFVGEGNGDVSINGMQAWELIEIKQSGDSALAPVELSLPYAPQGVNTTQKYPLGDARSSLERLEQSFNEDPVKTQVQYSEWVNSKYQDASTFSKTGMWVAFIGSLLIGFAGALVEHRSRFLATHFQNIKRWTGRIYFDSTWGPTRRDKIMIWIQKWKYPLIVLLVGVLGLGVIWLFL